MASPAPCRALTHAQASVLEPGPIATVWDGKGYAIAVPLWVHDHPDHVTSRRVRLSEESVVEKIASGLRRHSAVGSEVWRSAKLSFGIPTIEASSGEERVALASDKARARADRSGVDAHQAFEVGTNSGLMWSGGLDSDRGGDVESGDVAEMATLSSSGVEVQAKESKSICPKSSARRHQLLPRTRTKARFAPPTTTHCWWPYSRLRVVHAAKTAGNCSAHVCPSRRFAEFVRNAQRTIASAEKPPHLYPPWTRFHPLAARSVPVSPDTACLLP